jgi:LPXTG-motif cell wall-anchored protein
MVRTAGVASAAAALALGVAGNAFACSINEFSFSPSVSCDQPSGKGVITVVDKDYSGTKVDISVTQGGSTLATQQGVTGSKEGVTFTFPVTWTQGATYTVNVVKSQGGNVGSQTVTAPNTTCAAPASSSPSDSPSDSPTASPSSAPTTAAPSTSAAAVADTSSPSPSGSTSLAETGGGSNTGMIAGVAAVLVVVGGGGVFMLRRRNPAARH